MVTAEYMSMHSLLFETKQQSEGQPNPPPQNLMTLKCDLDFEFAQLSHRLCTQLIEKNYWVMFNENRSKGSEGMERTRNPRVNPMTLNCDLAWST